MTRGAVHIVSNSYISADLARLRQQDDIRAAQGFRAAHVDDEPDDAGWRMRLLEWVHRVLKAPERSRAGYVRPALTDTSRHGSW